jgi:hypothetical protein
LVDKVNKVLVTRAYNTITEAPRGTWCLVRAYDGLKGKTKKDPTTRQVAQNAGYVIFKDSKVVILYSNDLKHTPVEDISPSTSQDAIDAVHGVHFISRWTGVEMLHRSRIPAPSLLVAYNVFMNSVDLMDQRRAVNPTKRKEPRLSMTLWTWALDLALHNAFALRAEMNAGEDILFREFKRRVAEQLVTPLLTLRASRVPRARSVLPEAPPNLEDALGESVSNHVLVKTKTRRRCFLCRVTEGKETRTSNYCLGCAKGFCLNCHASFHHNERLRGHHEILNVLSEAAVESGPYRSRRVPVTHVASEDTLVLRASPATTPRRGRSSRGGA